jgi:endonuclease YncB( thermonuclease family)
MSKLLRATLVALLLIAFLSNQSAIAATKPKIYRVASIIDGDTLRLVGRKKSCRLLGINAPELHRTPKPGGGFREPEFYGQQAADALTALVAGVDLYLGYEKVRRDLYGRYLIYLWRASDRQLINLQMVVIGAARYEMRFRTRYRDKLITAETAAKAKQIGMWMPH